MELSVLERYFSLQKEWDGTSVLLLNLDLEDNYNAI